MSNLGKSLLAGICLAAALAVAGFLSHERQPQYQGRSLSQWLHPPPPAAKYPNDFRASAESLKAIRSMGTNAIPTALRWIRYEPSTLKQRAHILAEWVHEWIPEWIPWEFRPHLFTHADLQAIDAENVFLVLGPSAKPAIPELVRLATTAKGEERVGRCTRALVAIGPEALPALAAIAGNPNTKGRSYVIWEASALDWLSTSVPLMLKMLSNPDPNVATSVAMGLGFVPLSNSTVIPALVEMLQSTNAILRGSAEASLARFGSDARVAIPALMKNLSDPDTNVRLQSALSLHQIEPEIFTNKPSEIPSW